MESISNNIHEFHSKPEWEQQVAFRSALRLGDLEKVRLLIDSDGVSVDSVAMLHLAVRTGNLEIVKLLVDKGVPLYYEHIHYETPLVSAIKMKKFQIADYLLTKVDIKVQNKKQEDHKTDFVNKVDLTLLHIACMRNKLDVVKELLEIGASVNKAVSARSLYWPGFTALHFAVQYQCIETVDHLLNNGADFTIQDTRKLTPLHMAYNLGNDEIVDLILSHHIQEITNPVSPEGISHFQIACTRNNPKVVQSFIAHGVDINMSSPDIFHSWRPIETAITHECDQVIKLLLTCKVDISKQDLYSVQSTKNKKIIDLFLSIPAMPTVDINREVINLSDGDVYKNIFAKQLQEIANRSLNCNLHEFKWFHWTGYTPVHLAVKNRHIETMKAILKLHYCDDPEYESYIIKKDKKGRTPLHLAFETEQMDAVDLILAHHESIHENPVNNNGLSHFHICCFQGNLKALQNFIENGVNINSQVPMSSNIFPGYTPLHFAVKSNQKIVFKILLEKGADITIKNKERLTAYDMGLSKYEGYSEEGDIASMIESVLLKVVKEKIDDFDDRGFSLLHLYCTYSTHEIIADCLNLHPELINKRVDWPPSRYHDQIAMQILYCSDNDETVKLMIRKGIDLLQKDGEGNTLVHHFLSFYPPFEFEKSLLDSLDMMQLNSQGKTYFQLALEAGHLQVVEYFLEKNNTDLINIIFTNKKTPLHLAVSNDFDVIMEGLIEKLLKSGANVNAPDSSLNTPLHEAMGVDDLEITEMLLENGADIHAKNIYHDTVLHTACSAHLQEKRDKIQLLINMGADINAENLQRKTPIMMIEIYLSLEGIKTIACLMKYIRSFDIINYFVSNTNKEYYEMMLPKCEESNNYDEEDFTEKCLQEIEKLKKVYVDKYTTLRDILFKSSNQMAFHCQNSKLKKKLKKNKFYEKYPYYGHIVKRQFVKGCIRKPLLEKCMDTMKILVAPVLLPDSCIENILQYLSNEELDNIIKSGKKSKQIKRERCM